MMLGEVVAGEAGSLDLRDQAEPLREEFTERQIVAVEVIEDAEVQHGHAFQIVVVRA